MKQAQASQYLPKLAEFLLTEKVAGYGRDQKQKLIRDDLADRKAFTERQLNGHVTSRRDDTRAGPDAKLLRGCGLYLRPVTETSRRRHGQSWTRHGQSWTRHEGVTGPGGR